MDHRATGNIAYGPQVINNFGASPAAQPVPAQPSLSGTETTARADSLPYANAVDDLLDELASIKARVTQAQDSDWYRYDFYLPSHQYAAHKNSLAGDVRAALRAVYVRADHLNRDVQARDPDGSTILVKDDLSGLLEAVAAAESALGRHG